jgi:hypothetical protein
VELTEGTLFAELMEAMGNWLWHSDRTNNGPELGLDLFGGLVAERGKGRMGNIDGDGDPIAWCGSPLWMMIAVEAGWHLAPSFFWTQGMWGSLLCGGWFHCRGTYSMKT